MSLKIFPTNFVYWEQIHDHEKIKKELLSLISNYEKLHEEHSEGFINATTSYACHDIHNYIHRIGRSGRWGRKGVGINLITRRDVKKLKEIEEYYSTQINELSESSLIQK